MPEHQPDLLTTIKEVTQTLEEKAPNIGATEKEGVTKIDEQRSSDNSEKETETAKGGGIVGAAGGIVDGIFGFISKIIRALLFGTDKKEEEAETKDSLLEWFKKLFGIGKEVTGKQVVSGIETEVMQKKLDDKEVVASASQQGAEVGSKQEVGDTEASVSVSSEEKSQNQATRLSPEEQQAEIDKIEKESMANFFKLIKTLSNGEEGVQDELVEFVAELVSGNLTSELQERWNDTMKKVIADLGEEVEGQEGAEGQVEKAIGEKLLGKIEEKSKEKSGKSTEVSMENARGEVDAAGIGVELGGAGVTKTSGKEGSDVSPPLAVLEQKESTGIQR